MSDIDVKSPAAVEGLSYAATMAPGIVRRLVAGIENASGRRRLLARAAGDRRDAPADAPFFERMAARFGLTLDVSDTALARIPASGPVIVVANHPYGILDGLVLGRVIESSRRDFKILANAAFGGDADLAAHVLPIRFDDSAEAVAQNLRTRREALAILQAGGVIGVFPGGTVSTAPRPFGRPADPVWRSFTARLIARSGAEVVPVFFPGSNSRLFQVASHLHLNLRLALLISEFGRRVDGRVAVRIGDVIKRDRLDPFATDAKAMMAFLRHATYELGGEPALARTLGLDFAENNGA